MNAIELITTYCTMFLAFCRVFSRYQNFSLYINDLTAFSWLRRRLENFMYMCDYTRLYSFKLSWRIVSFTAAKTNRIFSVSENKFKINYTQIGAYVIIEKEILSTAKQNFLPVAHVKCEQMIFSVSGFKSTNIRRMNSRAVIASF